MTSSQDHSQEEARVEYHGAMDEKSAVIAHEEHHITIDEAAEGGEGILLTINTKDGADTTLKLARDGHVCISIDHYLHLD
jgi:hypothetical protein